jgi:hypothetical protein
MPSKFTAFVPRKPQNRNNRHRFNRKVKEIERSGDTSVRIGRRWRAGLQDSNPFDLSLRLPQKVCVDETKIFRHR